MPLYEYKCSKCGKTIEVIQKFSDAPLKVHEDCGGDLEKLLSASAFQLKGTGWYATDYAKKSSLQPAAKADGRDSKESSSDKKDSPSSEKPSGSESKTESKPAETATKSD